MSVEPLNPAGRTVLGVLLVLGLGHLLAFIVLFGPFLVMAAGAHYGSMSPLLLLAPTLLLALATMVYALFAVLAWASAWEFTSVGAALDPWRHLALWTGALSWLLWALVNAQVLIAFLGDAAVRHVPSAVFLLPTLGILYGVSVATTVTLVLTRRRRRS